MKLTFKNKNKTYIKKNNKKICICKESVNFFFILNKTTFVNQTRNKKYRTHTHTHCCFQP